MTSYLRQLDIFNPNEFEDTVHIVGCGGIGSPTALAMAKMGIKELVLWDFDTVEDHNLPNQIFKKTDVGRPKVEALKDILEEYTDATVKANNSRVSIEQLSGHVVVAVDNMQTRKEVYEGLKERKIKDVILLEARMGGQFGRVYRVRVGNPIASMKYKSTLYSDEEAVEERCTDRAIIYNVFGIAAVLSRLLNETQDFMEVLVDYKNLHTESNN